MRLERVTNRSVVCHWYCTVLPFLYVCLSICGTYPLHKLTSKSADFKFLSFPLSLSLIPSHTNSPNHSPTRTPALPALYPTATTSTDQRSDQPTPTHEHEHKYESRSGCVLLRGRELLAETIRKVKRTHFLLASVPFFLLLSVSASLNLFLFIFLAHHSYVCTYNLTYYLTDF